MVVCTIGAVYVAVLDVLVDKVALVLKIKSLEYLYYSVVAEVILVVVYVVEDCLYKLE